MTRYEVAPAEACEVIQAMSEKYHQELDIAGVRVDCLFAFASVDGNGDPVGSPVKLHGYTCYAVIRVIGLKDRTAGRGDAEIVVDGDIWDEWSDDEKAALIDHELTHLELVVDNKGAVKRDDLERPRLKIRKHDHQFGWFDSVARRHGGASFEVKQFAEFSDRNRQQWLAFMETAEA